MTLEDDFDEAELIRLTRPPATLAELASRLDVDVRTLARWQKEGCPLRVGGEYSVSAVRAWRRTKPKQKDPRGRNRRAKGPKWRNPWI